MTPLQFNHLRPILDLTSVMSHSIGSVNCAAVVKSERLHVWFRNREVGSVGILTWSGGEVEEGI